MLDVLTIGDSSLDLFMRIEGEDVIEETDHDTPRICFYHGSKIPVNHFETTIAGNALNVTVAIKNLGLKTALYSEIGDDQNAEEIIEQLNEIGIETKYIHKNEGTLTDVHTVIVYKGERTIFSFHGKRNYQVLNLPKSKWIYYTSMGEGFETFQKDLVEHIRTTKTGLAFNPGTIQMMHGIDSLRNILEITDILFVNKEEAQKLTRSDEEKTETLHTLLHDLGPNLTVITDGKNGASAYDGQNFESHYIYSDSRPLLDMTGAGDAFSSGFMSAIVYGKLLKEALSWGTTNSGNVIKEIGSIRGLTDKETLEKILKVVLPFGHGL